MKKNIILLVLIFLALPCLVHAVSTFVIQETDKLSLQTNATDPDKDKLSYYYNPPLNQKGEWQTTYGDAGRYGSLITVSDGLANATQEIFIIVKRKEEPPKIEVYSPTENPVRMNEWQSIKFYVSASDLNKDELTYIWFIDGRKSAQGQDVLYTPSYNDAGTHNITAAVSDGLFTVNQEWIVEVENVDIQKILDSIEDITINETEIAGLNLPNFTKYGLTYTISEPIGNDNEWQTTYDDEGVYNVRVHAEGNGFAGDKNVKVTVKNVDRPPVFEKLDNQIIDEGKTIKIILISTDPDGNAITYSADKLPEGAKFEGNVFTWVPSFDTVKKEDFIDYFVEKFTLLSKNFYVQFAVSSQDKKVVQNVVITVKDANRPPILEDIAPINVNEGETIKIVSNAYDPDGDKIKFIYSGFMKSDTYKTTFGDAGNYTVTVTASDGNLQSSKDVKINIKDTNRVPVFSKIPDKKAKENENIVVLLDAKDPDNDQLSYSLTNPPDNSSIRDNVFTWTPSYSVAGKGETKKFDLVFTVTDGKSEAKQIGHFEISDKNRVPIILNASKTLAAEPNQPVFMFVNAYDPDGDRLSYIWDFGLLDRYEGTDKHQRIFTTPGSKEVKVTVSDGTEKAEQVINVFVRGNLSDIGARVRYFNETFSSVSHINVIAVTKETRTSEQTSSAASGRSADTPPRIIDASSYLVAKVNEPVLMFVKAVDDDGDKLTYTWDFGLFDSYHGSQYHQRTFTTTGIKSVKVTVSDGRYEVVQIMAVNVVE